MLWCAFTVLGLVRGPFFLIIMLFNTSMLCYFEQHDSSPQTFCCCDFGPSTLRTNALQLERPQETLPTPPAVVDVGKVARAAQLSTS